MSREKSLVRVCVYVGGGGGGGWGPGFGKGDAIVRVGERKGELFFFFSSVPPGLSYD